MSRPIHKPTSVELSRVGRCELTVKCPTSDSWSTASVLLCNVKVMAFPDFPFREDLPSFIGHDDVRSYLVSYAQHFDLLPFIKASHSCRVYNKYTVKIIRMSTDILWRSKILVADGIPCSHLATGTEDRRTEGRTNGSPKKLRNIWMMEFSWRLSKLRHIGCYSGRYFL